MARTSSSVSVNPTAGARGRDGRFSGHADRQPLPWETFSGTLTGRYHVIRTTLRPHEDAPIVSNSGHFDVELIYPPGKIAVVDDPSGILWRNIN